MFLIMSIEDFSKKAMQHEYQFQQLFHGVGGAYMRGRDTCFKLGLSRRALLRWEPVLIQGFTLINAKKPRLFKNS